MRLTMAGQPDESLAERVRTLAATVPDTAGPPRLSADHCALRLRQCADPVQFDTLALELLRHHIALHPQLPVTPPRRSIRQRILERVRRMLWRLLGDQLERLALQQTRINELLLEAIQRTAHVRQSASVPPPPRSDASR